MDQDGGLICILSAEADLSSDDQRPGNSSFQAGATLIAAESTDHETLPMQSKSVCQTGGEGMVLSSEEFQIITLIVSGYTNQEMARYFCFSEATIHRRTLRIIEKLGVANKLELVLYALSHRVVNWFPRDPN
ncbi:MAG: LuxR C-terminal-related transcriptional regulator [Terriglobia bacterium]|jgi:DNA-binding NarL/FixJ family response regulator